MSNVCESVLYVFVLECIFALIRGVLTLGIVGTKMKDKINK